jgi:hypothetical protein
LDGNPLVRRPCLDTNTSANAEHALNTYADDWSYGDVAWDVLAVLDNHDDRHDVGSCPLLTLLVNSLSGRVEFLEGSDTCWSRKVSVQPGNKANQINGGSNTDMLQMSLIIAYVARTTHAEGTNPL